ncbi:MAG: YbaY family lipoprotein [Chloroflexi bacterium]|nr:YbaY family lipoprotein [Chloroflexota bacterium]
MRFDSSAPPFDGATLRIKLRDVTMAGAAAQTVAEQVISGVSVHQPGAGVPYELRSASRLEPGRAYLVEVHVDLNSTGQIKQGDFITMASHPVPITPTPARVDVQVHQIG